MTGKAVTKSLVQMVEQARTEIAAVLPAHMSADKVIRAVRLAIAQNRDLDQCDPKTVLFAVMAASRLGLEINSPLHECSLVPFKTECTLMIEYRGFQSLARRSGDIRDVQARCVYEGDSFDYQFGTAPRIDHRPGGETDDKKITHAYAIGFYKDVGAAPIFDVLNRDDIEKARKVSRFSDRADSPWQKWYGEMARKTAVRRLAKYLPLSPELAAAIELDLRGDTGDVSAPIPLIDSPATLNDDVARKTMEKLDEVKARLGGPQAATPPMEPGPAPAANAVASESSTPNGQPW